MVLITNTEVSFSNHPTVIIVTANNHTKIVLFKALSSFRMISQSEDNIHKTEGLTHYFPV